MEQVFERYELKYRLSAQQRDALMKEIALRAQREEYGAHTIMSLYYDTRDFRVIRRSLEKPAYREKLRVRSYGTPRDHEEELFLELKKKLGGVTYKRRTRLSEDGISALLSGTKPPESRTERELYEFSRRYPGLAPRLLICYERDAFVLDGGMRITFDRGIRYRAENADVYHGTAGTALIGDGESVMEIKLPFAMPLWLSHALYANDIYPCHFSKCAEAYSDHIKRPCGISSRTAEGERKSA